MRPAEERFTGHLVENESVQDLTYGRLLEDTVRGRAVVGLTDRRLLCISKLGEFVDVRYDYICSINSRRRTRVEYRSQDENDRLQYLLAGLLGLVALAIGVVATTSIDAFQGAVTVALAVGTVADATAIEHVRTRPGVGRAYEQVIVGAGILALLGLVGIGLLAASVSTALYLLLTLGGLVLAGYAARHRENLSGPGLERQRETLLSVNTIDGETVRVAVDAETDLDRELSACVHRSETTPVEMPVARSPSD